MIIRSEGVYAIVTEKDDTGLEWCWSAWHPEFGLYACMADGRTEAEAIDRLNEVTPEYIAGLVENHVPLPKPNSDIPFTR